MRRLFLVLAIGAAVLFPAPAFAERNGDDYDDDGDRRHRPEFCVFHYFVDMASIEFEYGVLCFDEI